MSSDLVFLRNKAKAVFDLRSEVDNHLAPNVTLISSDNVKVKGHSIILVSCPYFRELFNNEKSGNSYLIFQENFTGDVLELLIKYIYTGEYSLLSVDKLPEVIRATSKEKFNIPELAESYLLKQFDGPEGLNQANWHIFYKSGIQLSLGEEYCKRIYSFLKEKHPEFYKSDEFIGLSFDQICKIMKSPNRPFESNNSIMEASFIWTIENKAGISMGKLAELSQICINLIQNGNLSLLTANSSILDASIQSASTQACPQPTILSDPHCSSTRKRSRSISPQINAPNLNNKRSNVIEVYQPPKYSWGTAQLLFFGKAKVSKHGYLWSYIFQSGELKRMARMPIENLERMSLLASQDRIYSIGGSVKKVDQNLVRSFATRHFKNMDKTWKKEPKLNRATCGASTLLFRNTIYLFPGNGSYNSGIEKWDNHGAWEDSDKHMLYYRSYFGVALLNNVIYMIGGDGSKNNGEVMIPQTLDSAESYNIDDGTQSLLPSMNQARVDLRVIALKDRIYAIGGFNDDFNKLASVESYKPGDPSWKQVANMNQPRAEGSAFVLDDEIYVVGGNYGPISMERYCPQEDTWTMVNANLPEWAELFSSVLLGPNNF